MVRLKQLVVRLIDSSVPPPITDTHPYAIDAFQLIPFFALHVACLGVFWVSWSGVAVAVAAGLYAIRMFAITAWYHRYFSHRAFRAGRWTQFAFACLGASAMQRGPLWWAAHHRHHHAHSDDPSDSHSPRQHGFLWSHAGWFLSPDNYVTRMGRVKDWAKFPELVWIDRYNILCPAILATGLFLLGSFLGCANTRWGTNGPQMLVWGFCISTVAVYHATYTINSLAHRFGSRPYPTQDDSRNNWWLALITFGEGWHNNHHFYPASARQGFLWWQLDLTYYGLWLLGRLGLIWELHPVPEQIVGRARSTSTSK